MKRRYARIRFPLHWAQIPWSHCACCRHRGLPDGEWVHRHRGAVEDAPGSGCVGRRIVRRLGWPRFASVLVRVVRFAIACHLIVKTRLVRKTPAVVKPFISRSKTPPVQPALCKHVATRRARTLLRHLQQAGHWNPYPFGPLTELVRQFMQGFVERERPQQNRRRLIICRPGRPRHGGLVFPQKRVGNRALPHVGPPLSRLSRVHAPRVGRGTDRPAGPGAAGRHLTGEGPEPSLIPS